MSDAVRDIQGKIKIHADRVKGSLKWARRCIASKDYNEAITALQYVQFHQAMVDELKSVKP